MEHFFIQSPSTKIIVLRRLSFWRQNKNLDYKIQLSVCIFVCMSSQNVSISLANFSFHLYFYLYFSESAHLSRCFGLFLSIIITVNESVMSLVMSLWKSMMSRWLVGENWWRVDELVLRWWWVGVYSEINGFLDTLDTKEELFPKLTILTCHLRWPPLVRVCACFVLFS